MKYTLICGQDGNRQERTFSYRQDEDKRPMALDVLLQAKSTTEPDLAFRYGCRNELCGVCTVEVNGEPRLACRSRVSEGDSIGALSTLPLLQDMVVERKKVNQQLIGIPPLPESETDTSPSEDISSLNRCIECYGCLSGCPMHKRNEHTNTKADNGFAYGNPYTMLKLRSAMLAPGRPAEEKQNLLTKTIELGLDSCLNCDGCKCQVGIELVSEVIEPLLAEAASQDSHF